MFISLDSRMKFSESKSQLYALGEVLVVLKELCQGLVSASFSTYYVKEKWFLSEFLNVYNVLTNFYVTLTFVNSSNRVSGVLEM